MEIRTKTSINSIKNSNIKKNHRYEEPSTLFDSDFQLLKEEDKSQKDSGMTLMNFWPGNHNFICNGRYLFGNSSDRRNRILTTLTIVSIYISYMALPNSYIYKHINTWLPWLTNYLFATTLLFLFLASATDPGLIPPRHFL